MGSCVSISDNVKFLGSSSVKTLETNPHSTTAVAETAPISSKIGSKDEAFFDSQPWLDSDCEDDFVSVNGGFTPSRGSTPVHPISFTGDSLNSGSVSSSPVEKKTLSEHFKNSLRVKQINMHDKNIQPVYKSDEAPPCSSIGNSGRRSVDGSSVKSGQCCIPALLLSSRNSVSERKKRLLCD